jgi:hypothetical protein
MTSRGPARTAARSLTSSSSSAPGAPAARHLAPSRRLLAVVALVALIGAGCANAPTDTGSGGGENPATEGSPSTEPDPNASGGTGGGDDQNDPAGAAPDPASKERTLEFAQCMRENGVEDFPDPNPDGVILYYGDSPQLTSAGENCRHLRPEGQNPGNGG